MEKKFTLLQTIAASGVFSAVSLWYGFMFGRESARKELGNVIDELRHGNPNAAKQGWCLGIFGVLVGLLSTGIRASTAFQLRVGEEATLGKGLPRGPKRGPGVKAPIEWDAEDVGLH